MPYIFDTNIWIDLTRGKLRCKDLMSRPGYSVALAPLIITEFMKGVITGGESQFVRNQSTVACMALAAETLALTKGFIFRTVWNIPFGATNPDPAEYRALMRMLTCSTSLADFLRKTERPESNWKEMNNLASIHESVLNTQLGSLDLIGKFGSVNKLHLPMAKMYTFGGLLPDPDAFENTFSAATEFIRSSILQVRNGANPKKNNRGLYIDWQLFWYLADPEVVIVTNEDFSNEIRASPQRDRIISYRTFSRL